MKTMLKNRDSWVRECAIVALGKTLSAKALPILEEALSDKELEVRHTAITVFLIMFERWKKMKIKVMK